VPGRVRHLRRRCASRQSRRRLLSRLHSCASRATTRGQFYASQARCPSVPCADYPTISSVAHGSPLLPLAGRGKVAEPARRFRIQYSHHITSGLVRTDTGRIPFVHRSQSIVERDKNIGGSTKCRAQTQVSNAAARCGQQHPALLALPPQACAFLAARFTMPSHVSNVALPMRNDHASVHVTKS
jgi:hypothetical protein